MDEEAGMRRAQHAGVVVRIARRDDLEVQAAQRVHGMALLVGLAQHVALHEAVGIDLELVAQQRRPRELAHQRLCELVERVRQDQHLVAAAQVVEEVLGAGHRPHAGDHVLDVGEPEPVLRE